MKRKETPKQRGPNKAGWRAPELQVQIVVLLLETNWLSLMPFSCMFKTETEALEGFSTIVLQPTAVAPVSKVIQPLPCTDI